MKATRKSEPSSCLKAKSTLAPPRPRVSLVFNVDDSSHIIYCNLEGKIDYLLHQFTLSFMNQKWTLEEIKLMQKFKGWLTSPLHVSLFALASNGPTDTLLSSLLSDSSFRFYNLFYYTCNCTASDEIVLCYTDKPCRQQTPLIIWCHLVLWFLIHFFFLGLCVFFKNFFGVEGRWCDK